jgi:ribonuclease HI
MDPVNVYAFIDEKEWKLTIPNDGELIVLQGDQEDEDKYRNEIRALMEMLCFLRKFSERKYLIYTNSSYCFNLCEKWIPKWLERKFRLPNSESLRPNSDLLVQLYSFQMCMEFQLLQHYDSYEEFKELLTA